MIAKTLIRLAAVIATAVSLGSSFLLSVPTTLAAALPDNRAYELVSTADKGGLDVLPVERYTRVAVDGDAATYSTLGAFADAVGTGIQSEYMAVREPAQAGTGQGWVTHAITPLEHPFTIFAVARSIEVHYEQGFSPDLSTGVVFSPRPLTDEPFVENVVNLYIRNDLSTPGDGHYTLVTSCPACIGPFGYEKQLLIPKLAASTPDFGKLLFESPLNLTAPAKGVGTKLYEWDATTRIVTLVGIMPDGSAAPESLDALGIPNDREPVEEDSHTISEDGSKVFFTAPVGGVRNLYMRVDGKTTVQLNKSELSAPESPQSAAFGAASADGSRVFFTSGERLTEDAPGGGIYMYDTTKSETDPSHLTYIGSGAVMGASADGDTLYFAFLSFFKEDVTSVWHMGETRLINERDFRNPAVYPHEVTPAGDLVYLSHQSVGPEGYDHGNCSGAPCAEVYVYSIATNHLSCASCNPSGTSATAGALLSNPEDVATASSGVGHRVESQDGKYVFFMTPEALVPQDVNGKIDVYEYNAQTGAVNLISSGTADSNATFMNASPSGNDAFFLARDRLVGWDRDENYDLYDARVNGGFPEPPMPATPCSLGGCQEPSLATPAPMTIASALVSGAEDRVNMSRVRHSARAKRCRAGFVRRRRHGRARCVRRGHFTQRVGNGRGGSGR